MAMTVNLSNFSAACRQVRAVTKKSEAEIVTRAARNVGFRAAQFTPKASPGKIRARLRRDKLVIKLAASQLKREKGKFTKPELNARIQSIEKRRTRNVSALRAGWAKGIIELGGSFRGSRLRPSGSASRGFGRKATISNLVAVIRNSIVTKNVRGQKTGAGNIPLMEEALFRAVEFATADMHQYAQRKLAKDMHAVTAK